MAPVVDFQCRLRQSHTLDPRTEFIGIYCPEIIQSLIVGPQREDEMPEFPLRNLPCRILPHLQGLADIVHPIPERIARHIRQRHRPIQKSKALLFLFCQTDTFFTVYPGSHILGQTGLDRLPVISGHAPIPAIHSRCSRQGQTDGTRYRRQIHCTMLHDFIILSPGSTTMISRSMHRLETFAPCRFLDRLRYL